MPVPTSSPSILRFRHGNGQRWATPAPSLATLALLGCGSGTDLPTQAPPPPPPVPIYQLAIEIQTTGENLDQDGYLLSVDGSLSRVSPNQTLIIPGIKAGWHSLHITDLSRNCRLPRVVSFNPFMDEPDEAWEEVRALYVGEPRLTTTFAVRCHEVGALSLVVVPDAKGGATSFRVVLNHDPRSSLVRADQENEFDNVSSGDHSISIRAACAFGPRTIRLARIIAGRTVRDTVVARATPCLP